MKKPDCLKHGFTIIEIMVVLIIIGFLSAIALPRLQIVIEKFRAEEGKNILRTVFASQKRYFAETKNYAPAIALLDVELKPSANFNINNVYDAGGPYLGTITRIGLGYILKIREADGQIECSASTICGKIGF